MTATTDDVSEPRGHIEIVEDSRWRRGILALDQPVTLGDLLQLVTELHFHGFGPDSVVRVTRLKLDLDGRPGNRCRVIVVEEPNTPKAGTP